MKEKVGFGDTIEAELYRKGKLVPDKPKTKFLVTSGQGVLIVSELIPKEKSNEN